MNTRIPPGAVWRILYHDAPIKRGGMYGEAHHLCSSDYPQRFTRGEPKSERCATRTIFDELFVGGIELHLEQMDARTWFLAIGDDKVMITVDRNGKPQMGEWYK